MARKGRSRIKGRFEWGEFSNSQEETQAASAHEFLVSTCPQRELVLHLNFFLVYECFWLNVCVPNTGEGIKSPGVTGGCGPLGGCLGLYLSPLPEQQVLLPTEPSLQPPRDLYVLVCCSSITPYQQAWLEG